MHVPGIHHVHAVLNAVDQLITTVRFSMTDLPKALDPIYNRPQTVAKQKPLDNPTAYNRWRANLPAHCWNCVKFDVCAPNRTCPFNKAI